MTEAVLPRGTTEALAMRLRATTTAAIDPAGWASENAGVELLSYQRRIAESVRDHRLTAVQSCHGIGKSLTAAVVIAWWIASHPPGQAFAVSTAPTWAQVRSVLWRELRRAHIAGGLPGHINLAAEWLVDDQLVAVGRKPADHNPAAFQGIHDRYVLAVVDEASGVASPMFQGIHTVVTNADSRVLAIGNPDDPSSDFRQACAPNSEWNVIAIGAEDTPAWTGEPCHPDVLASLISKEWAEEREREWGRDSAMFRSKVRGLWTDGAVDSLIAHSWVAAAAGVEHEPGVRALGVDVGAGGDESACALRDGNQIRLVWRERDPDTMRTAEHVARTAKAEAAEAVYVDSIGIGKGVADRARQLLGGDEIDVHEVNVGGSPRDPARFPRLRDEVWWSARDALQAGEWRLVGLDEDGIGQLTAPRWAADTRSGRTKVESKGETKKRTGGKSPDSADAMLLCMQAPPAVRRWGAV